jgi:hypothetical protein
MRTLDYDTKYDTGRLSERKQEYQRATPERTKDDIIKDYEQKRMERMEMRRNMDFRAPTPDRNQPKPNEYTHDYKTISRERTPDRTKQTTDIAKQIPDISKQIPDRAKQITDRAKQTPDRPKQTQDRAKQTPDRDKQTPDRRATPNRINEHIYDNRKADLYNFRKFSENLNFDYSKREATNPADQFKLDQNSKTYLLEKLGKTIPKNFNY